MISALERTMVEQVQARNGAFARGLAAATFFDHGGIVHSCPGQA
jgi:hypothetical protein